MARRKRICIFMGEIPLDFQRDACREARRQGKIHNVDIVLFASCGSYIGPYGRNVFFELGEKNVIHLPDVSKYDGVLVFSDTFDVYGMDTELYDLLKERATCPVISIRNGVDDFPVVSIDNINVFKEITNHFINHHGFKNICFMSGPLDMKDGRSRYDGYVAAMNEAGLPIKRNFIFEGNYWRNKGFEAVEKFFECDEADRPEAIVCANDYMAISIIDELRNRGIKVPEEVCVSGFDNIPESRTASPTLTTVVAPPEAFIVAAFDALEKMWTGEKIESVIPVDCEMIFRQSCGCGEAESEVDIAAINSQLMYFDNLIRDNSRMVAEYQNSFEFDNTMVVASHYFPLLGCETGYYCMCDENDPDYTSVEANKIYSDNMILKSIMHIKHDEKTELCNIKFNRANVLPDEYWDKDESNFLIVFTIHFRSTAYGYLVLTPTEDKWPNLFANIYLNSLSSAIERGFNESRFMEMEEIRNQYLHDPLTGVYNRRGFEKKMQNVLNSVALEDGYAISFASVDMDNLKNINDVYGHAEGDFAITTLAKAVMECIGSNDFCSRMGGDEFSVVILSGKLERHLEFQSKLEKTLKRMSTESGKPYAIHASVGICGPEKINGINLFESMKLADDKMYNNKRRYKNGLI